MSSPRFSGDFVGPIPFAPYRVVSIIAAAILWVAVLVAFPLWAATVLTVLLVASNVAVYRWNRERRTARLLYDTANPEVSQRLEMVGGASAWLSKSQCIWHVYHSIGTTDARHHAGASSIVQRTRTLSVSGSLPQIELNVPAGCVPLGPQQLLFLPDRLVVMEGGRFASIGYEHLQVSHHQKRFIEEDAPPADAEFIEWTWRYVNKSGTPDRRFKDNRKLPILRYGELHIDSAIGIRVVLQCSNGACSEGAARALNAIVERATSSIAMSPSREIASAPVS